MRLSNVGIYRQEIMGFAIFQIILFHSNIEFDDFAFLKIFGLVKNTGYFGVDIFFFLSGFSLAAGWLRKKYKLLDFYKKRITRILPGFLVIAILTILSLLISEGDRFTITNAFSKIGLGFVMAKNYDWWFIPAILFCYTLFPWFIKIVQDTLLENSFNSNIYLLILIYLIPCLVSLVLVILEKNVFLILFSRIPNFILGITIAVLLLTHKKEKLIRNKLRISIILMSVIGVALFIYGVVLMPYELAFSYGFLWYPFIFLTLPITLLLGQTFRFIDEVRGSKAIALLLKIFSLTGGLSYELFLTHGFLINSSSVYDDLFDSNSLLSLLNKGRYLEYLLVMLVSFLCAICLKTLNLHTVDFYRRYKLS